MIHNRVNHQTNVLMCNHNCKYLHKQYKAHTIIVFFYPRSLECALSRAKKHECSKKCNKLFNNISMKTMCSLHFNPKIKKIMWSSKCLTTHPEHCRTDMFSAFWKGIKNGRLTRCKFVNTKTWRPRHVAFQCKDA
jgi:hypothetical protein